jgi:hypothetical protein
LVLPDAGEPMVHVYASSANGGEEGLRWVESQVKEMCDYIETFCRLQSSLNREAASLDL